MAIVGATVGTGGSDGAVERAPVEGLTARHREMIRSIEAGETLSGEAQLCFVPGTPQEVVGAFRDAIARANPDRFQGSSRWTSTASGSTGAFGEPITLTWSLVPDGTTIPNVFGEGTAGSDLESWLNGIYGNQGNWLPLFQSVFDRWDDISGINFVYEPNDDGAQLLSFGGILGTRGDVRIGAKTIDGNSGILAFNFFPNNGDMVLDSADNFYNFTSQNSRRLRNVISHEHGHGHGQEHVCPVTQSKLMEPFASTVFDGPQHDDVRGVQWRYGDVLEPDNNAGSATDLGLIANGTQAQPSDIPGVGIPSATRLSIDTNGEQDWFRFDTQSAADITVTVAPVGLQYSDGPQLQNGSCSSGTTINTIRAMDLAVQLVDSDGSTVLATANSGGLGDTETIVSFPVPGAGSYFVRVYEQAAQQEPAQLYSLVIDVAAPPAPGAFGLLSPLNGATGVPTGPTLDWEDAPNVDDYLVEVDDDSGFGSPEWSSTVLSSEDTLPGGTLAEETTYFWRVTARNDIGDTPSTPAISSFETVAPPPCPCVGDLDNNCTTDVFDFTVFSASFGSELGDLSYNPNADYDGDDAVTVLDFGQWASDFGCTGP